MAPTILLENIMKRLKMKYNKELKCYVCLPGTPLEAIEQLQMFFQEDMWHAKESEWKNEEDMINYLNAHFDILKKQIRKLKGK